MYIAYTRVYAKPTPLHEVALRSLRSLRFLRGAYASLRVGFAYAAMVSCCFRLWHESRNHKPQVSQPMQNEKNELVLTANEYTAVHKALGLKRTHAAYAPDQPPSCAPESDSSPCSGSNSNHPDEVARPDHFFGGFMGMKNGQLLASITAAWMMVVGVQSWMLQNEGF